jgi:hypothetical protein
MSGRQTKRGRTALGGSSFQWQKASRNILNYYIIDT